MWLLYGVLIYVAGCLSVMLLGGLIGYALSYLEHLKNKIQDHFIKDETKLQERKFERFMKVAVPDMYQRFTPEQQEYCQKATSAQEFVHRYREVLAQNSDIMQNFFDKLKEENKDK